MVHICSLTSYPAENETKYKDYFNTFSYPLHIFQKWAIEGIVEGQHVLVTAPTGSGKSLPAEFAIHYFHSKGKKIIYTTPIKALSNEKFYSFTKKYPHISIGILTGDLRYNPDADCLIMTTEILLNKLYQIKSGITNSSTSFEMDIEKDLACVVFDEIHFINDESRGHVWEQSIMMLPSHVQMVGLSATLDNPEKFAQWLETCGGHSPSRSTYLARKQVRTVPLIHYSFLTAPNSVNKHIKDKATQEEIRKAINKPFVIQNEKNVFNDTQYQTTRKMLTLFDKHDIRVKRAHVLNKVAEYLVENEMLPALCYVFSRKQLEQCAEEMTANLLEFDSKVPYTVDRECEQILRKMPNFEEYLRLPEYVGLVTMLRKGVAIHHAGMMPILREMVELMFARGFIKLLFCTETMSIGINLPVKTTLFTDINKYNGSHIRPLYSHEYTQSAGRAGRLGLDKVGHVIHLNNLFRQVDPVTYKTMMNGTPQTLTSKFKISYNLLLSLIDMKDTDFQVSQFAEKSMIQCDLDTRKTRIEQQREPLRIEITKMKKYMETLSTPLSAIQEYDDLQKVKSYSTTKKRKEMERKMRSIQDTYKNFDTDKTSYIELCKTEAQLSDLDKEYKEAQEYITSGVHTVLHYLIEEGYVEKTTVVLSLLADTYTPPTDTYTLTPLGQIASQIRELHCLLFAKTYKDDKRFHAFTATQLVSLFSIFTNIRVPDDIKDDAPKTTDKEVGEMVLDIDRLYKSYMGVEMRLNMDTGFEYELQYDLLGYVERWCECETVEDCKLVLQELADNKQVFLGEFVKALLKINNIACEFEKIAEMTGDMEFLSKLKEIPHLTLKYVVTNQSLYVSTSA